MFKYNLRYHTVSSNTYKDDIVPFKVWMLRRWKNYLKRIEEGTNQEAGLSNLAVTQEADLQSNHVRVQLMGVEQRWWCRLHRFKTILRRGRRRQRRRRFGRRWQRQHAVFIPPGTQGEAVQKAENAWAEDGYTVLNRSPKP